MYQAIRGWERRTVEEKAGDLAQEQVEKLRITMLRSMEILHSITAFVRARGEPTREEFRRFAEPALARQPELQALEWIPRVSAADRERCESAARADGVAGFRFTELIDADRVVEARPRAEYFPVLYVEPMTGNLPALGLDLAADPQRSDALQLAARTGQPIATPPIRLAQESGDQSGFLVFVPFYQADLPIAEERPAIRPDGFAVAVFRVNNLVSDALRDLRRKGIEAQIRDDSVSGDVIYATESASSATLTSTELLNVAGRRWAVLFGPTKEFLAAQSQWQSRCVLLGGLAFSFLTTAYLYGGWRRTRQIAVANAALEEEVAVRQRAESLAAAANQAKSDFLACMSHEIRTPLNAILGYTQLMQREPGLPPEQRDTIAGISASGYHLLGLINEILDLSKIEAGRMDLNVVDFDLGMLANGLGATFRPLCARQRIGFRLQLALDRNPRVRGDEGKLRQVLINLLGNAIKFTSDGEVCLRISVASDDAWLFEVIDTGLGIPEAEQQDIFKPFHQGSGARHLGGTGLGLAIAQRQVQLLGGKLELQSERGAGSRFYFRLRLEPATAAAEEVALKISRLASGQTVRALVVDDHEENRAVLGGMLSIAGCEVLYASSGNEALVQVRAHSPQIVFLDVLLPDGSGIDLSRKLNASAGGGSTMKIVAHTASALPRYRDEALAAGCVDFILKPVRCEQLYECLERHLGVVFERHAAGSEPETLATQLCVELPEELCARLMVAAELHSTTALKAGLQDLRRLGPDAAALAAEIRQLMRSYDMNGIQRLLTRVAAPVGAHTDALPATGTVPA